MLRDKGVLEESVDNKKPGIRREDSYNMMIDETGRHNMLA